MDRTQQAIDFIVNCCLNVGDFYGPGDVYKYLMEVAEDMRSSKPSVVFPDRYIEHVTYAIDMVAQNLFTTPAAAIGSFYLATRFELYFRILSGKLNADGTWISKSERKSFWRKMGDKRLDRDRISRVADAYRMMKWDQSRRIAQICASLDATLYSTSITVAGGDTVADIGDRIQFGRNAAGHGHWGDISGEALFYGLLTAVVFYNQS